MHLADECLQNRETKKVFCCNLLKPFWGRGTLNALTKKFQTPTLTNNT
jgi:hypothetical protein